MASPSLSPSVSPSISPSASPSASPSPAYTTTVSYILTIPLIDSVAVLGVNARFVSIIVKDVTTAEVYNELVSLASVDDEPEDVVKLDLPEAVGGTLEIVATGYDATAKIGEIVIGNKSLMGDMRYSPEVGIIDYSIKETDAFGNYIITERAYSKTLSCDIRIDNDDLDDVYSLLAEYRATPLVWVGSVDYGSLIVYGFCKNFDIVIPYNTYSDCSLDIEGLS